MDSTERTALLSWAMFFVAVVAATSPAWRMAIFGISLSINDLLSVRCVSW